MKNTNKSQWKGKQPCCEEKSLNRPTISSSAPAGGARQMNTNGQYK